MGGIFFLGSGGVWFGLGFLWVYFLIGWVGLLFFFFFGGVIVGFLICLGFFSLSYIREIEPKVTQWSE